MALVVFYGLNGVTLDAPDNEAYEMVIAVARGTLPYEHVARLLASWRTGV